MVYYTTTKSKKYIHGDMWLIPPRFKLHSWNDKPAIIFKDGSKMWYNEGEISRLAGPAIIRNQGITCYVIEGKYLSESEFYSNSKVILNKISKI